MTNTYEIKILKAIDDFTAKYYHRPNHLYIGVDIAYSVLNSFTRYPNDFMIHSDEHVELFGITTEIDFYNKQRIACAYVEEY